MMILREVATMKLFKKLRQAFCAHRWTPIKVINTEIYSKYDIRYAKCHSVCDKCGKEKYVNFMMDSKYQDRMNNTN